mmetsp:Transcript_23914/g.58009  ORF Transcript_23914/g.58009 Transcript_23914/m.58009 type:complete len:213 (-) Transcript_23914:273-911(-)
MEKQVPLKGVGVDEPKLLVCQDAPDHPISPEPQQVRVAGHIHRHPAFPSRGWCTSAQATGHVSSSHWTACQHGAQHAAVEGLRNFLHVLIERHYLCSVGLARLRTDLNSELQLCIRHQNAVANPFRNFFAVHKKITREVGGLDEPPLFVSMEKPHPPVYCSTHHVRSRGQRTAHLLGANTSLGILVDDKSHWQSFSHLLRGEVRRQVLRVHE